MKGLSHQLRLTMNGLSLDWQTIASTFSRPKPAILLVHSQDTLLVSGASTLSARAVNSRVRPPLHLQLPLPLLRPLLPLLHLLLLLHLHLLPSQPPRPGFRVPAFAQRRGRTTPIGTTNPNESRDTRNEIPKPKLPPCVGKSDVCNSSRGWGQEGALAVSGSCDREIRVWDVRSGFVISFF